MDGALSSLHLKSPSLRAHSVSKAHTLQLINVLKEVPLFTMPLSPLISQTWSW